MVFKYLPLAERGRPSKVRKKRFWTPCQQRPSDISIQAVEPIRPCNCQNLVFFFTFKSQCPHLLTKEILEMPSFTQKGDH